jgi:hypothetical protein
MFSNPHDEINDEINKYVYLIDTYHHDPDDDAIYKAMEKTFDEYDGKPHVVAYRATMVSPGAFCMCSIFCLYSFS